MLTSALELAADGGWDAVAMREVASRAEVAIGTLYRYFPSKENLLVSLMLQQIRVLQQRIAQRPPSGRTSSTRLEEVLARANKALQSAPGVTTAMIKALVSGNTDVAPVVGVVRDEMRNLLATAYVGDVIPSGPGDPSDQAGGSSEQDCPAVERLTGDELLRIELLSDIWLATLISWICEIKGPEGVQPRLAEAVQSLFH